MKEYKGNTVYSGVADMILTGWMKFTILLVVISGVLGVLTSGLIIYILYRIACHL